MLHGSRGSGGPAVFAVYLSFFATVVPLDPLREDRGMALTGLTARGGPRGAAADRRRILAALARHGLDGRWASGFLLLVTQAIAGCRARRIGSPDGPLMHEERR